MLEGIAPISPRVLPLMKTNDQSRADTFLLDAHVHLHEQVAPSLFLDMARKRFRVHLDGPCRNATLKAMMLLCDGPNSFGFKRLSALANPKETSHWQAEATDEPESIHWRHPGGDQLTVISGRQLVSSERLELLVFGTTDPPPAQNGIIDLIKWVRGRKAMAVLPWGVGKWTGKRGRLVAEIIQQGLPVYYGDNGGRPGFWHSRLLTLAKRKSRFLLSGSDALPISSDHLRSGEYGIKINGTIDFHNPLRRLQERLAAPGVQVTAFGSNVSWIQFVSNQIGIRIAKNR